MRFFSAILFLTMIHGQAAKANSCAAQFSKLSSEIPTTLSAKMETAPHMGANEAREKLNALIKEQFKYSPKEMKAAQENLESLAKNYNDYASTDLEKSEALLNLGKFSSTYDPKVARDLFRTGHEMSLSAFNTSPSPFKERDLITFVDLAAQVGTGDDLKKGLQQLVKLKSNSERLEAQNSAAVALIEEYRSQAAFFNKNQKSNSDKLRFFEFTRKQIALLELFPNIFTGASGTNYREILQRDFQKISDEVESLF